MDRRDWIITFCLLLPFFITLPWGIVTHGKLQDQRELTELTRDTLYLTELRFARMKAEISGSATHPAHPERTTAPQPPAAIRKTPASTARSATTRRRPARPKQREWEIISDPVNTITDNPRLDEQVDRLTKPGLRAVGTTVSQIRKVATDEVSSRDTSRFLRVRYRLESVPEAYQGEHTVYLVVTDQRGNAVTGSAPSKAQVPVQGATLELTALGTDKFVLVGNQQLQFEQRLNAPLTPGRYRAQLFSDIAPLGVTDFVVN